MHRLTNKIWKLSNQLASLWKMTLKKFFDAYLPNLPTICEWQIQGCWIRKFVFSMCLAYKAILKLSLMDYLIGIRCSLYYFPMDKHLLEHYHSIIFIKNTWLFKKIPPKNTINQTSLSKKSLIWLLWRLPFLNICVSFTNTSSGKKITTHTPMQKEQIENQNKRP